MSTITYIMNTPEYFDLTKNYKLFKHTHAQLETLLNL